MIELEQVVPWVGERLGEDRNIHGNHVSETRNFSWQERILGPKEKMLEENQRQDKIFTYTNADTDMISKLQKIHHMPGTHCDNNLPNLTKRRSKKFNKQFDYNMYIYCKDVEEEAVKIEYMYILVDLKHLSNNIIDGPTEYVLVELMYNEDSQVMTIYPDITDEKSSGNPGHTIKPVGGTRMQYVYWISIVQDSTQDDPTIYSTDRKPVNLYLDPLKPKFEDVRTDVMQIHIFGTISKSLDFDFYSQVINYTINLPEGWHCDSDSSLAGATQESKTFKGIAVFNHVFEVKLSLKSAIPTERNYSRVQLFRWPELFIQVSSKNLWGCISTEGYTWLTLPTSPGHYKFELPTYVPVANNVKYIRKYFLGTSPQIGNTSCCGLHQSRQVTDRVFGKYGCISMASGKVAVDLNIIHQKFFNNTTSIHELCGYRNVIDDVFETAHHKLDQILAKNELLS